MSTVIRNIKIPANSETRRAPAGKRAVALDAATIGHVKRCRAAILDALNVIDTWQKLSPMQRARVMDSMRENAAQQLQNQPGINNEIQGKSELLQNSKANSSTPPTPEGQKVTERDEGEERPNLTVGNTQASAPVPTQLQQVENRLARLLTPAEMYKLADVINVSLREFLSEEKIQELLEMLATQPPTDADAFSQQEAASAAVQNSGAAEDGMNKGAYIAARVERDKQRAEDAATVAAGREAGISRAGEDSIRMALGMSLRPFSAEDFEELFARGKRDNS